MRVLVLLAIIGAAMAAPKNIQRIVGGSPTHIEQYNFIVGMMYSSLGIHHRQICGGTLVTTTSVVSAAHCYFRDTANQWVIRAGSTNTTSGGYIIQVSRLILHANFEPRLLVHDIAIVRLTSAVTLSSRIGLARIAGPNYQLPDNTRVYAAGWGILWAGGPSPGFLQHVGVYTINHAICTQRYAYLKTVPGFEHWPDVTPEMLCLGILDVGGKDACQGDSGGPAVHQGDILVGITSWGYSCAHYFYPGVNVRVSSYTSWITQNSVS